MEDVTIYTTTYCPYCQGAKQFLDALGLTYKEIDLTNDDEAREKVIEETGHMTVPVIFVRGEFVGGFDDLRAYHAEGKLLPS